MVYPADIKAASGLLLEMAFEAQALVADLQHLVIGRSVNIVAGNASFPHGLVFEDIGAALGNMTGLAGVVFGQESGAPAVDGVAFVRIVAIAAAHAAFRDWMVIRLLELAPFIQVAFVTVLGGPPGIYNSLALAARSNFGASRAVVDRWPAFAGGFDVNTGGTVAGLTPHVQGVGSRRHQPSVRGGIEILGDIIVTLGTSL